MNRRITNVIRAVMDEGLPPFVRDSRWFMYPFFAFWFKGQNIGELMDFKTRFWKMSDQEIEELYRTVACRANDRPTDLSEESIRYMFDAMPAAPKTLLDVGCGRGYFVERAMERGYDVTGSDVFHESPWKGKYIYGNAEKLPVPDKSFDIVTCSHTIEHVRDADRVIAELKRVAKETVVVVTPKQRPFYYTLDLHVRFFPYQATIESLLNMRSFKCKNIAGDWVYIGDVTKG